MLYLLASLSVLFSFTKGDIGYVKINNSSCHYASSCGTVDYYASQSPLLVDNYTLIFAPGIHHLQKNLVFLNSSFVILEAEEGSPQQRPVIVCRRNIALVLSNIQVLKLKSLMFEGCGGTLNSFNLRSALRLDSVMNLTLLDVHVHNSYGYGVFARNIGGQSSIENCTFFSNTGSTMYNGGNAYVEFANCSQEFSAFLVLKSSIFFNGSYTGYNYKIRNHTLATGITIILSCSNTNIHMDNITLSMNHNYLNSGIGGNMFIHYFNTTNSISNNVWINNSRFYGGIAELGAGLATTFFTKPRENETTSSNNRLTITNSKLWNNSGLTGCGLYVEFVAPVVRSSRLMGSIIVVNTSFINNTANLKFFSYTWNIGIAIFILNGYVRDGLSIADPFSIYLENITVERSKTSLENKEAISTEISAAILCAKFSGNLTLSNSRIENSEVTAISLLKSKLSLSGTILIRNNTGIKGGGLVLCGFSYIELHYSTTVKFIGNSAAILGGAIYSETQCRDSYPICFYHFVPNNFFSQAKNLAHVPNNSSIIMENNTAGIAGMDIYGGNVASCYFHRTGLPYRVNSSYFYKIFKVKKNVYGHYSTISSDPIKVCGCDSPKYYNCSKTEYMYPTKVYPGQDIYVLVILVGQLNGTVPGSVLINGKRPYSIIYTNNCTQVPIKVIKGVQNYELQVMNTGIPKGKSLRLPQNNNLLNVKVNISRCPVGFVLKKGICSCDNNMTYISQCNISSFTITRIYGSWIGYVNIEGEVHDKGLISHKVCPVDYCEGSIHVTVHDNKIDSDDQCSANRTGLLCSSCQENFSVSFSSTACLDCRTSPRIYPFLVSFAVAIFVLLLIVILIVLDISTTDGLLAGLLFYSNVIYSNKALFRFTKTSFFTVVISLINLDLNIDSCFYNGLDTYSKTWFQLCWPQFLWLFIAVIILLSQRFKRVAKLVGKNSAKILATLIELTFSKTLQACITVFAFISIEFPTPNGKVKKHVWLHDANIEYLQGKHIPLFLIAFVLSVFLLAYTLFLLFIKPLQKYSHMYLLLWVNRLKPLIDAYTAPHVINPQCRFWGGYLLFLRIILSTCLAVDKRQLQDNSFGAIIVVCLLVFVVPLIRGKVYKSVLLNILNFSFFMNLISLSLVLNNLYHEDKFSYFGYTKKSSVFVLASSGIVIFTGFGILIFYIIRRLRNCCNKKCILTFGKTKTPNDTSPLLEYSQK